QLGMAAVDPAALLPGPRVCRAARHHHPVGPTAAAAWLSDDGDLHPRLRAQPATAYSAMSRKQPPPQDTPPRRPPRQTREAAPPERPARAPSKPKAQPKRRPSQPAPEKRAKQPRRRRRRFLRPAQIAALILVLLAGLVA